mmetsp:Transcript_35745/g.102761  ORF Transcript_35745/g.102761 Transcript_35745/m.102761 type:complete len:337 (-) Transcript_35745:77-1087(-)
MTGSAVETPLPSDVAISLSGSGDETKEAKAWTEVFTLFQQSGRDDRGAAYAMTMGSLRRQGEDLDRQLEELEYIEEQLLAHAREEAEAKVPNASGSRDAAVGSAASSWGRSLACGMTDEVRLGAKLAAAKEEHSQAAAIADRAHEEALETLEQQQKEKAEAEARAKAEEEAQAQSNAEAPTGRAQKTSEAERAALRAQGLNSRRLPLRPGTPPCGYFMRKGVCKNGRSCIWDHPEPELNSLGYPVRPGLPTCALFQRTHTCKFGALCGLDHPEVQGQVLQDQPGALPLALAKAAAQQHQLQLMLHLQLVQELPTLKDPEAMMDAWVKFRITFSLNA